MAAVLGAVFAYAVLGCLTAVPVAVLLIVLRRPLLWLLRGTVRGMQEAGPVYGWVWREVRQLIR